MSFGEAVQNGPDDGAGTWSEEPTGPAPEGNVDAAFKLQVEEGSTVSATFPFFGDVEGGQLSFQIGDHITVRVEIGVRGSTGAVEQERNTHRKAFSSNQCF